MNITGMSIGAGFKEMREVLERFSTEENFQKIQRAGDLMVASIQGGGRILACGNGGSLCDAMHFAEELTGRFRDDRRALPAIAISDPSHLTCVGNDYGYEHVFSRYIEAVGRPGDTLLGISTSGNSKNVIQAVHAARKQQMKVVVLTSRGGGALGPMADVEIRVQHDGYADRAQEIHIKVIHTWIQYIESKCK